MTAVQDHSPELAARGMTLTLEVCDDLDISTVPRLRERLTEAVQVRPRAIVVDLTRCGFLDSRALAPLLEAHRAARRRGVRFGLRGLTPQAQELLELTGLSDVFDVERTP